MTLQNKNLPHAIFLDIDGTLSADGNTVSEKTIETINKLKSLGHFVFLNTGRGTSEVPLKIVKDSNVDGVISSLGAHVTFRGKVIHEEFLPENLISETVDKIIQHKAHARLASDDTVFPLFSGKDTDYKSKEEFFEVLKGKKLYKVFFFGQINGPLRRFIRQNYSFCQIFSYYGEGAKKGCNKATGIKHVLEYLSIPFEQSISIGDSDNDIHMLKSTQVSVAMATSPPEVKRICDFVTDSAKNDGVANALTKLFLIQE